MRVPNLPSLLKLSKSSFGSGRRSCSNRRLSKMSKCGTGPSAASGSRPLIGVAQMCSTNNIEENISCCENLVAQASNRGCALVCLPENFVFLGSDKESLSVAEPLSGPLISRFSKIAKENKVWLSLGGFPEKIDDDSTHIHNAHVIMDDKGDIQAVYRKIHLFDTDFPQKITESDFTSPGKDLVVVDSPIGKLGLAVCYDLRFPELFVKLRELGAQVLLVPAAFTYRTGVAHWDTLVRARAIETQCFVAAATQGGKHNETRESFGNALVVDPWGEVTTHTSSFGYQPRISLAEIDLSLEERVRKSMPVMQHRTSSGISIIHDSG